jgi:uncharacterized membrane protein
LAGLTISKESVGGFVDAVYAVAVTILALEIPAEIRGDFSLVFIGSMLLNYGISFFVLFALWLQHRRINEYLAVFTPLSLWLNASVLLLVCLIPRATTFVFEYGGNITLTELEASLVAGNWTRAEIIDVGYSSIIILADLGLSALMRIAHTSSDDDVIADVVRSKFTISGLLLLILAASLVTPIENRYFLFILPVGLMCETWIAGILKRFLIRRS